MGKCGRRRHHELARVSIDAIAGNGREIGNGRRSLHPRWEKARDDVIAYLEFSHTVTDAFDKPSTVRHWDTAIGHAIGRAHHSIVMEVERTCMQSRPDRSRPGCSRIGQFDMFNPVETAWRSDDDGLQVGLQFKRLRGTAIVIDGIADL
jgi:hypothetical protein